MCESRIKSIYTSISERNTKYSFKYVRMMAFILLIENVLSYRLELILFLCLVNMCGCSVAFKLVESYSDPT